MKRRAGVRTLYLLCECVRVIDLLANLMIKWPVFVSRSVNAHSRKIQLGNEEDRSVVAHKYI